MWICCQLGAREHYSIPRGLHQRGLLAGLVTETWVPPNSILARIGGKFGERLSQRYDEGLADANVYHTSSYAAGYELFARIFKSPAGWSSIMARNDWFQTKAVRYLKEIVERNNKGSSPIVFTYSYAARKILLAARDLGCTTVLGQIDAGPVEERIVSEVRLRHGYPTDDEEQIPEPYWDAWREECEICDSIIVNSPWAREALIREGVNPHKLLCIPLAYDPPGKSYHFQRRYPERFDHSRPLRVLFLGSLIARKGVYELINAASLLKKAPVKFLLVGSSPTELGFANTPNLQCRPSVARARVHDFYKSADVFIFPTHSDGFGLTQVEAMAWGLPVIASQSCANVVTHRVNGLVLPAVTAEEIVKQIDWLIDNADVLSNMSDCAFKTSKTFRSDRVISQLLQRGIAHT